MNPKPSDYTSRLLCEGWVEKQIILSKVASTKQTKPKSRFATLTLFSGGIEIRFYPKNPKHCKELLQEKITLLPWKYCVYMEMNTNKTYQVILKVFDNGLNNACTEAVHMNMRSLEEAAVWMKCTQSLTKLSAGSEEQKFTVKTTRTKVFEQLGVADIHCILYFTREMVKLALKSDLTIVALWPIPFIRSYSSQTANSFSITAGRRSPLGEATYDFMTLDMDANKLFQILDYYTGVTDCLPRQTKAQPVKPVLSVTPRRAMSMPQSSHCQLRPHMHLAQPDPDLKPLTSPPPKPPRKPTLPLNRPSLLASQNCAPPTPKKRGIPLAATKQELTSDLDSLLHSLEYSLGMSGRSSTAAANMERDECVKECRKVLNELVDKVSRLNPAEKGVVPYSSVDYSRKSLKKKNAERKDDKSIYF